MSRRTMKTRTNRTTHRIITTLLPLATLIVPHAGCKTSPTTSTGDSSWRASNMAPFAASKTVDGRGITESEAGVWTERTTVSDPSDAKRPPATMVREKSAKISMPASAPVGAAPKPRLEAKVASSGSRGSGFIGHAPSRPRKMRRRDVFMADDFEPAKDRSYRRPMAAPLRAGATDDNADPNPFVHPQRQRL